MTNIDTPESLALKARMPEKGDSTLSRSNNENPASEMISAADNSITDTNYIAGETSFLYPDDMLSDSLW